MCYLCRVDNEGDESPIESHDPGEDITSAWDIAFGACITAFGMAGMFALYMILEAIR